MRKILEQAFQTRVRTYWIPFPKDQFDLLTPEFGQTIDRICSNILTKIESLWTVTNKATLVLNLFNKLFRDWTCRKNVILIFSFEIWPISWLNLKVTGQNKIVFHVANFCLKFKKHDSNRRHENRESFIAHFISCETPFRMFENERKSNEIFGLIVDQEQYKISLNSLNSKEYGHRHFLTFNWPHIWPKFTTF